MLSSKLSLWSRIKAHIGHFFALLNYQLLGLFSKKLKVIFVSDQDAKHALRFFIDVHVIPNGTDSAWPLPKERMNSQPKYIFHGDFSYAPNIYARLLFDQFLHTSKYSGVIFGKNNTLQSSKQVTHLGYVADLSEYITYENIYFCPLPFGGGIKNKVLEALAAGMLVVGTQCAFDGIDRSKISSILFNICDLDNPIELKKLHSKIIMTYQSHDPYRNIDYIRVHHDWKLQVAKLLEL